MIIKDILFVIKEDIKTLRLYPETSLGINYVVDYSKYWQKRRRTNQPILSVWQKERAIKISKIVNTGDTIMDVGCGDGAVLKFLMDLKGVTGIGVDVNDSILENAKKLGIETFKCDISNLPSLSNLPKVDYIMGLEILEHMPNPEEFIVTMLPKVRKGMIFSFPNTGYYIHRLRLLFGSFPLQWILHPSEHLRYWTVRDVKWWVNSLGLRLTSLVLYQGIPILNKIIPTLFARGIIIHISNKDES